MPHLDLFPVNFQFIMRHRTSGVDNLPSFLPALMAHTPINKIKDNTAAIRRYQEISSLLLLLPPPKKKNNMQTNKKKLIIEEIIPSHFLYQTS